MRIMLFPKMVAQEETEEHHLKDCFLVIDGANFFYNTYEDSRLPYVFGIEADNFARYLKNKVLGSFKRANVQCYVIFKGGDCDIDQKIKKYQVNDYDNETNRSYQPPIFMTEVYKEVLNEAAIDYATCVLGSKDECVALAEKLQCSVLSNDIEFCFRQTPYIPRLTLKPINSNLTCKRYKLQNFLSKHSLTESKFVLFALLADTHLFPMDYFDRLFEMWGVNDMSMPERYVKLLKWLAEHSADDALYRVTEFLTDSVQRNIFLDRFHKLLEEMQNVSGGVVTDFLSYNEDALNDLSSSWFEIGVASQHIPICYINLYKYKVLRGSDAIETRTSTDSITLSIDIIKYAYNLLTDFRTSDIDIYQDSRNHITVNTDDLNIRKPQYPQCRESVFENGWADVKHLNLFEHFLDANSINTEIVDKFPDDCKMLVIALAYAFKKMRVDIMKEIYCFIISYVMLGGGREGITETDFAMASRTTKRYFMSDDAERSQIYDGNVLNTLVQLQYCLLHMNYLNTLCGTPYKPTKYYRTFNGTFIYKLLRAMRDNNNNNIFVHQLFSEAPTILRFVEKLIKYFKELSLGR